MTRSEDEKLNDLIRAASARDVDEAALIRGVNARLEPGSPWWARLPSLGPGSAVAGFAAMLLVAGFVGYSLPNLEGEEDGFLSLAMGEPASFAISLIDEDGGDGGDLGDGS